MGDVMGRCGLWVVVWLWMPLLALAQGPSLFAPAVASIALTEPVQPAPEAGAGPNSPSTFIGAGADGLFAPWPDRALGQRPVRAPHLDPGGTAVARLLSLIASVEAGPAGYDAVQHGARIRPPGPPTSLSLKQIDDWIRATPGQPHAIGRYQFIPPTFRRLVRHLNLPAETRFSPQVQDRMADVLLQEAGFDRFQRGDLSQTAFMNNLARIWAGLPNSSGRSHYHGYAGNRAGISWTRFQAEMARIFPEG